MAKVHVHGVKRAEKVLKRKQRLARAAKKTNIKQAIYTYEKALKAVEEGHEGHDHGDHEGHDHA